MSTFEVTEHVCRVCLGAIIRRNDGACRCSDCGATGNGVEAICGCGWRLPSDTGRVPARFSCIPNPARSPSSPTLCVIAMIAAADQHITTGATPSAWPPARAAA